MGFSLGFFSRVLSSKYSLESLKKSRLLLVVVPPSDGSSVELVALSGAAFQSLPNVAKGQTYSRFAAN